MAADRRSDGYARRFIGRHSDESGIDADFEYSPFGVESASARRASGGGTTMSRVFLLSPARCDGRRATMLLNPRAEFELALRLRPEAEGAPIGEVFSFLSGLYFRGKLTYATAFSAASTDGLSSRIITTDRGLLNPTSIIRRPDLVAFSSVDIASGDERYLAPLRRDAEQLGRAIGETGQVVLLGSIATGKYVDTLIDIFGDRVLFPIEFVGRGDMSRGGLLLRHAREGRELEYQPVRGAIRHGRRPPKLTRDISRRRDTSR
jgi:hypothetical protein